MSTSKPRITITLEPHTYDVVRRLSAANEQSMSAVVVDFLQVAVPPMERLVVLLEQAAAMPDATREEVRASVLRAEEKLHPLVTEAQVQRSLDFVQGVRAVMRETEARSVGGAEEERSGEGAGRRGAPVLKSVRKRRSTPVPVTRGSGPRKVAKRVK